jgi:hypothetical protein
MKKEKILSTFWIAILVAVLIIGVCLIYYSSNLNEHLEGVVYNFDFYLMTTDFNSSSNDKIHLQNFIFYYHFTQNKGSISFGPGSNKWSLHYIDIDFPSVVDNKTIRIYTTKNGIKHDVVANIETHLCVGNYTRLTISDFKRTFNDEKFVIEFKSDLQPKGRFGFLNNERNRLHGSENVNFVFGDEYECTGVCVYSLKYIEETPNSFDGNLKLNFKKGGENHCSSFKLNAISREIKELKILSMRGGFLLIGVSLSFILGLLYKYGKEKDF